MMTPFPDAFRIRKIVLDAEEIQYAESANAATSGTAQVAAIGRDCVKTWGSRRRDRDLGVIACIDSMDRGGQMKRFIEGVDRAQSLL
ncbi:MAG TPA: hypothetical protein VFC14_26360, partial [Burkholderiales bacterium]|nr:hypothetical protein [Burkholderiales bacterium]